MPTNIGIVASSKPASSGGSYNPFNDGITFYAGWWAGDITVGDGSPVSTWPDGTGNGHDMIRVFGTTPTLSLSHSGYNNRPVVMFANGNYDNGATYLPYITQPITIVVVGNMGHKNVDFFFDSGRSANRCAWYQKSTGLHALYAGSNWYPTSLTGNPFVGVALYNGSSSKFRLDGVEYTGGNVGTMGIEGFTLGARYNDTYVLNPGEVALCAVYDGDLTAHSSFSAWETNLRNHYGL